MEFLSRHLAQICLQDLKSFPILTLTGPRQSGKSTLLKKLLPDWRYVSLEDPSHNDFAAGDPVGFLQTYSDKVVFDEIQRAPKLLSSIQVEVDRDRRPGRFALSGSHNLLLLEQVSQTLAGRTSVRHLLPFSYSELNAHGRSFPMIEETLFFGAYPPVIDAPEAAVSWLGSYIQTYIERDVRLIRNVADLGQFRRFVKLCAGRAGQLLDLTSVGKDVGLAHNTVRDWIGVLEAGFVAFRLHPYFKNFSKRLIKSPKLFFYDTGVLCRLLDILSAADLHVSPFRGAIFENWCVVECLKHFYNCGASPGVYFWKDKAAEVDIVMERSAGVISAFECKSSVSPPPLEALAAPNYLKKIMAGLAVSPGAVYAGSETQSRTTGEVLDWVSFAMRLRPPA